MADPVYASGTSGRIVIIESNKELAVGEYTLERAATLADIANSLTGGWDKSKRIRRGGKLTATIDWDAGVTPEAAGVDEGDEFTANCWIGDTLTARVNGPLPDPASAP
jgi:hypothetical protein